jgi:hypothetical protein
MSRASWLAPLIAIGVNFAIVASQGGKLGASNKVQMIVGPLFILGGLILGIISLFGISKFGRNGILTPALVGISINLFLIIMGASPVLHYMANRAHLQPAVHAPSAHLLKNDRLRFSIDIPEGFREYPEGKQSPTIENVYIKGVVGGGEALTVINIERLGGLIPKNKPLRREEMPPGFRGELTTRNWRGLKVDTIMAFVQQNGFKMVVYEIQIPLKPSAIQLGVGGPETKRAELSQLADTLLSSLEGETNW